MTRARTALLPPHKVKCSDCERTPVWTAVRLNCGVGGMVEIPPQALSFIFLK